MNEVKYEPIFGDQSLFDGAPEDAEAVGGGKPHQDALVFYKFSDGEFQYKYEAEIDDWKVSTCKHPQSVIKAMRRIIKVPTWTVEDQKAGKLPEVGVLAAYHIAKGKTPTEITSYWREGDELEIMKDLDEGLYSVFNKRTETCSNLVIDCINPIETQAEKAQRLEDEFINYVLHHEKSQINSSEELVAAKRAIKLAYKLQLSGELKAPGVE